MVKPHCDNVISKKYMFGHLNDLIFYIYLAFVQGSWLTAPKILGISLLSNQGVSCYVNEATFGKPLSNLRETCCLEKGSCDLKGGNFYSSPTPNLLGEGGGAGG